MKDFFIGYIIAILATAALMFAYHQSEYVRIRSEVIYHTGYDISYPEKWKK